MADEFTDGRGDPWEFDGGPPKNRSWARLFATTPNYRAIGVAMSGDEEYRWHFGPMFYRGRLKDDSVRVLVIGQEGAQDESLSHRSFTGGTGARMQHVLNHLGVTRSYLFLNTFCYPIFGQYNGLLPRLAQDPRSPIARHRGELLDYVLARNDLRLVIAVGLAAKQSVATWIEAHGGSADPDELHEADSHRLGAKVKTIGVLHPGGATKGGAAAKIKADFVRAIHQVEEWEQDDSGLASRRSGCDAAPRRRLHLLVRADPVPGLPVRHELAAGPRQYVEQPGSRPEVDPAVRQGWRVRRPQRYLRDPALLDDGRTARTRPHLATCPTSRPGRRTSTSTAGPTTTMARLLQGGSPGRPWPDFASLGLSANPSLGHGPGLPGPSRRTPRSWCWATRSRRTTCSRVER